MDMICRVPPVSGINPPYDHEEEHLRQLASECIWSDPAGEDQEESGELGPDGYGDSPRGGGTICFGNLAIDDFLREHKLSYIMRAHEAHSYGVSLSKGARCFTVFSTSKDHNQGSRAICGCVLVDFDRMEVITRSPHYRNQYVHRRDSVSLAALPPNELEAREKVGLITEVPSEDSDEYDDYDDMYDDGYDEYGYEDYYEQNGEEGAEGGGYEEGQPPPEQSADGAGAGGPAAAEA
uniref:Serine/threonine specific protein phosphatases domain-containing protein n=1 Tax=Rhizochromulina marina TaxID=1034831 RepID=A0A7S2WKS3_9STRA